VLPSGVPWRLILALALVALAGLTVVEAILGNTYGVGMAAVYGWLFGVIHAVWFLVKSRRRSAPAPLDRTGTVILATTLGAMAAVTVGNLAVMTIAIRPHATTPSETIGAASMWMILVGVLCWRAWRVRSARRAAVLQLCALIFAAPFLMDAMGILPDRTPHRSDGAMATVGTSPLVAFAVVLCAGAVFDRLFSRVSDGATVGTCTDG
jgi:hypothetical protein